MNKDKYSMTRLRILNEMANLNKLDVELREYVTYPVAKVDRIKGIQISDTFAMRAIASIISDYIKAITKVFLIISRNIDVIKLEDIHKVDVIGQMAYSLEGIRPEVISGNTYKSLKNLHDIWNELKGSYGYDMNINQLLEILEELPNISKSFREDLENFSIRMGAMYYEK